MLKSNYKIGIVGGMGPMAGVFLQKLIIENTPAKNDQDHFEVVCFTNPKIPDRTKSLKEDNGRRFVKAIVGSIKLLEKAGVNRILIPCNTSHTRFGEIQESVSVPIINMIDVTMVEIRKLGFSRVGLLATEGTISAKVFKPDKNLKIITPSQKDQARVTDIIYEIKSGRYGDRGIAGGIDSLIKNLTKNGAEAVILGCTELSIYNPLLKEKNTIDPLVLLAKKAIL